MDQSACLSHSMELRPDSILILLEALNVLLGPAAIVGDSKLTDNNTLFLPVLELCDGCQAFVIEINSFVDCLDVWAIHVRIPDHKTVLFLWELLLSPFHHVVGPTEKHQWSGH